MRETGSEYLLTTSEVYRDTRTEDFLYESNAKWFVIFFISERIQFQRLGNLILLVLFERSHEGGLLGVGLEPTVAKLGGCIDELQIDLLQSSLLGVSEQ